MTDYVRMIVIGGTIGTFAAACLIAPGLVAAVAEEPVAAVASTIEDLFPSIDPKAFRKYNIVLGEGVSTDVTRTQTVKKIGYGYTSTVKIVTTPSGTYSSDAIVSPHVLYPGIEVMPKRSWSNRFGHPVSRSAQGTRHWTSFSRGSIIYYSYSDEPATRT